MREVEQRSLRVRRRSAKEAAPWDDAPSNVQGRARPIEFRRRYTLSESCALELGRHLKLRIVKIAKHFNGQEDCLVTSVIPDYVLRRFRANSRAP